MKNENGKISTDILYQYIEVKPNQKGEYVTPQAARKVVDDLLEEIDNLNDEVSDLDDKIRELDENLGVSDEDHDREVYRADEAEKLLSRIDLPTETLHDEMKNEILSALSKNLTLEQLENLEKLAISTLGLKNYISMKHIITT